METAKEQSNKIRITENTKVAYINKEMAASKKVLAENLYKWIYRRIDVFPELLDACKEAKNFILELEQEGKINNPEIYHTLRKAIDKAE